MCTLESLSITDGISNFDYIGGFFVHVRSCGCGQEQWDGLDRDAAEVGGSKVEGKVQNDKT